MINNQYYYENSCIVTCTQKSISILQKELDENNYKCKECESDLFVITFMEGTIICCEKDINHKCGYKVLIHDKYYKKPPRIVEERLGEERLGEDE